MYSMAKSAPPTSCNSCWARWGVMLFIKDVVSSGSSDLVSSLRMRPWCRITGGCPTVMCKSLALSWMTVLKSFSIANELLPATRPPVNEMDHFPRLPATYEGCREVMWSEQDGILSSLALSCPVAHDQFVPSEIL